MKEHKQVPELMTTRWFNADGPIQLSQFRGKVIMLEAFQMLCPGCVAYGLPQAQRVHDMFSRDDVIVLGLHSVFEHHAAMTPVSLEAFLHEYRITFPVGVDEPDETQHMPKTMAAYSMPGTPTTILFGRDGKIRAHHFGQVPDLQLGVELASLITERFDANDFEANDTPGGAETEVDPTADHATSTECDDDGCKVKNPAE